jgi:lipoyl(octanoyl) transferase
MTRSNNKKWRLLLSGHADAYSNMALDEALLESYLELGSPPTLRIYGWDPAAISIGFAEEAALDIDECRKKSFDIVRRPTGGGALFHSKDISYSVVCSGEDIGCGKSVVESFKRICGFLLEMYKSLDIDARFACELADHPARYKKPSRDQANICMASHEKYDIVVGTRKLGGNAQKRRRGAILQHGSIPLILAQAPFSIEGPISLSEACGRAIGFEEVEKRLVESFENTFLCHCEEGAKRLTKQSFQLKRLLRSPVEKPELPRNDNINGLTAGEAELFNKLFQDKYSRKEWNIDRIEHCKKAVMA